MTIGTRIQQLRKAAGLSQEQMAECLGVSRQAVSKWENDQSVPETEKLAALCQVFSVSADELLGLEPGEGTTRPTETGGLEFYVRQNFCRRCFTAGWITALGGLVFFALEWLSLWVIRFAYVEQAVNTGTGFYLDIMQYAKMAPMPALFAVTALVILLGIVLAAAGLWMGRDKRNKKRG